MLTNLDPPTGKLPAVRIPAFGAILVAAVVLVSDGFLLYFFLDSEVAANLNSAHVVYRRTREMLGPVILAVTAFGVVSEAVLMIFVGVYFRRNRESNTGR